MHFAALWIPALLAILVLIAHEILPRVPILSLISSLALAMTLGVLSVRYGAAGWTRMIEHIRTGLPRMSGELVLFLAAGVHCQFPGAFANGFGRPFGAIGQQIADALFISRRTVEFHKYKLMNALGVKSSSDLVAVAIKHGVVTI